MTTYPFNLLDQDIYPLLGEEYKGQMPLCITFADKEHPLVKLQFTHTQKEVNDYIYTKMLKEANATWAVSGYLEDRTTLLSKYPQYVRENRVFHTGVDIIVPVNTKLYAPLDCEVFAVEYEEEEGSYGNLIVLKYDLNGSVFYSLLGHTKPELPAVGTKIKRGEVFAEVGDFKDNGFWFQHTHLQVFSQKAVDNGWIHKGYCTGENLKEITDLCANPIFLLKI
ncbi:MAG: hypothetical protein Ta2D_06570 [Rickettsiales bacterium]|nr:MAG: hypothetical protein Ta2D_06570 [Rickettsiales bacterium]